MLFQVIAWEKMNILTDGSVESLQKPNHDGNSNDDGDLRVLAQILLLFGFLVGAVLSDEQMSNS